MSNTDKRTLCCPFIQINICLTNNIITLMIVTVKLECMFMFMFRFVIQIYF